MHDIMYSSGRGFHKSQGNSETHQMARIIQLPHRGRKAIIPSGISEIIIRKIFMRFMLTFAWRSKSASAQQCIIKQVAIRIKRYFRLRMIFSALSTMAALSEFHLFYS
ncbi:hypothetical protein OB941_00575 [Bifidobacterium catenulatum subsp. kashiwanohense]|jgi:hypothetical protein|nr:hypothetical protein [Bifidobacterium catenulatum subsp. kashiwanohense]